MHLDVAVGEFAAQRLGEAAQRELGRRVHGEAGIADRAEDRAGVEDAGFRLRLQVRQQAAAQVHRRQQVGRDGEVDLLREQVLEHAEVTHARVVDQHVHAAAPVHGLVAEALPVGRVREIGHAGADAIAVTRQRLGGARQRGGVATGQQHGRAAREQLGRDRAADAARATRDQDPGRGGGHALFLRGRVATAPSSRLRNTLP